MKKVILILAVFLSLPTAHSQTRRVLFLGNSYTYRNSLPILTRDIASSMGDSLIFDAYYPGGYTLHGHFIDTNSVNKIKKGNWDYVVLQEQSQYPSLDSNIVYSSVFPYARKLDSIINLYNQPCVETIFYMTWGRKNGDMGNCPSWPYVCTYEGMDSLLNLRYRMMAESNNAILSPVGAVWHYIRSNSPQIELYEPDESHPSLAGSYAAACSFYTTIFRKDPTLISFNSGLSANDAADIRNAAKLIVYDSLLKWHIGEYDSILYPGCYTSVQDISSNSSIKVFPNPFASQTTLQSDNYLQNATLTVYSYSGNIVRELRNINGHTVVISRDKIASGLYYIRLTNGNKIYVNKLVITDR